MFDQAIILDSTNDSFYNNKGNALHQIKYYGYAKIMFEKAIELNPKEIYIQNKGKNNMNKLAFAILMKQNEDK
ncbi:hypothetical protein pb186bvf_001476 [Paramecium bursaria]